MRSGITSWVLEDEFLLDSPVIGFFGLFWDVARRVLSEQLTSLSAFGECWIDRISRKSPSRGDLVRIIYEATKDNVHYIFGKTVDSFDQDEEQVTAHFSDGSSDTTISLSVLTAKVRAYEE